MLHEIYALATISVQHLCEAEFAQCFAVSRTSLCLPLCDDSLIILDRGVEVPGRSIDDSANGKFTG